MKLRWRVSPRPTGRYRSFDHRSWPRAEWSNGDIAAQLYCSLSYTPQLAIKTFPEPILISVADHSHKPFKWLKLKKTAFSVAEAKDLVDRFIELFPMVEPKF